MKCSHFKDNSHANVKCPNKATITTQGKIVIVIAPAYASSRTQTTTKKVEQMRKVQMSQVKLSKIKKCATRHIKRQRQSQNKNKPQLQEEDLALGLFISNNQMELAPGD
jgi:hypothetical protein